MVTKIRLGTPLMSGYARRPLYLDNDTSAHMPITQACTPLSFISNIFLDTNHMYDTRGSQGIAMTRSSLHGDLGSCVHL